MWYAARPRRSRGAVVGCLLLAALAAGGTYAQDPPADSPVAWVGETQGARFDVLLAGLQAGALPSRILLNARDEANYLAVRFADGQAVLERTLAGTTLELGRGTLPEDVLAHDLVIQWRYDRVAVIASDVAIVQAYEHGLTAGKIGCEGETGEAELLVQPIDDVYFADDFGRVQASMGDWLVQTGTWANVQVPGEAKDAANPFAFEGKSAPQPLLAAPTAAASPQAGLPMGDLDAVHLWAQSPGEDPSAPFALTGLSPALAVNGHEFWSDYWFDVATRSEGATALGVVAFASLPPEGATTDDLLLARWTSQLDGGPDGDRIQLLAVHDGQATVLAEAAGGFVPEQWYRLRIEADPRRVAVLVDGRPVLETANTTGFVRGKVGLYGEGSGGARFDDARAGQLEPGAFVFPRDAAAWRLSPGVELTDDGWRVTTTEAPGTVVCPRPIGDAEIRAELRAMGSAGELLLGYRGEESHWAVSWSSDAADNLRLVRRQQGEETVLASATVAPRPKEKAVLTVRAQGEYVRVSLDGKPVIEAVDPLRIPGAALAGSEDDPEGDPRVGLVGLRLPPTGTPQVASLHAVSAAPTRAARVTEQFTRETTTMDEWATVAGAWIDPATMGRADGVFWNKGDFYGDVRMVATLAGGAGKASLLLGARDWATDSGYRLEVTAEGTGLQFDLLRAGVSIAQGTTAETPLPQTIRFERRGALLSAIVGSTLALAATDPEPLSGTKLGIRPDGLQPNYDASYAYADDLEDYTFSDAPTEWTEQVGTWELSSRWTCSPQWSWWSGRSGETAAMWSKPSFVGDQTVELYVAMKMGIVESPARISYPHPHDANITLCGDGVSIDSGYSFIIGGAANARTQIWKGATLLAETTAPEALLPALSNSLPGDMNEFHRHWWQVRAEKQGNRLRLYFDNRLAVEAIDEEPLTGGHVGIWTWQNGIMVARTRIYGRKGAEILAPVASEARAAAASQAPGRSLPVVASPTHPALLEGFEEGRGEVETYYRANQSGPGAERHGGREHGATVCIDTEMPAAGKQCLKLVNENPGGNFGVYALKRDFKPAECGTLGFDYRIGPETRVDIVLRTGSRSFLVQFTGDGRVPFGFTKLGRIEDVKADRTWRRAEFDLRGALQDAGVDPATETVTDVLIGCFLDDRLLSIGATGNPRGATWWLDNFGVYSPGPADGSFTWQPVSDVTLQRGAAPAAVQYRCSVSGNPLDEPSPSEIPTATPAFEAKDLPDGLHYLHVQSLDASGAVKGVFHSAFVVAKEAPALARTQPAGGKIGGGVVGLVLGGAPSGVAPQSLALRVAGQEAAPGAPGIRYEAVRRTVWVDLDRYVDPAAGATQVPVELLAGTTYAGTALAPATATFEVDHALDTAPPTPPVVLDGGSYAACDTFEVSTGAWRSGSGSYAGDGAALVLDGSTASEGAQSLALVKPAESGRFIAWALPEGFDAGKHRFLSFDYRIPSWIRIDMLFTMADGVPRVFGMTDNDHDPSESEIDSLPIVNDGQWHHIEIDLLARLQAKMPSAGDYRIARLGFGGGGWDGNPKGAVWHIDNFRLAAAAGSTSGLPLRWESRDATGIAGTSYVLDQNPTTEPDTTPETAEQQLTIPPETPGGLQWLHLRTVDGRGNWSDATHHQVLIDNGPVQVASCSIADGKSQCLDRFVIALEDTGPAQQVAGVDPRSIRLRINDDPPYTVDAQSGSEILTYDAGKGRLVWDGQAAPSPRTFLDGQEVRVSLESVTDYAGNPLSAPFATSFVMDFSKDNRPPDPPTITSETHLAGCFEPFEDNPGRARALAGCTVELDREAVKAPAEGSLGQRLGTGSIRVTRTEGDALSARLFEGMVDIARTPYLGFDYLCPAGTTFSLMLTVQGRSIPILFTEPDVTASRKVAGAAADGIWHHASVKLSDVAHDVFGDANQFLLRAIDLVDTGSVETPAGASIWIDNLWLTAEGAGPAAFSWRVTDATGIVGYSWVWDNTPFTIAPETVTGTETRLRLDPPAAGVHYLHVRALDGAGHWGTTGHYAIYQRE